MVEKIELVAQISDYYSREATNERIFYGLDAFGAALYLRQQAYVDHDSIGILGFSNGAVAGIKAVQKNIEHAFDLGFFPFKAAVLFYPWCDSSADQNIAIPTMIHIGSFDDWTQSSLFFPMAIN